MPKWYASADCLFFPSVQETFGLAIVEAAAAGLPLVLREIATYGPLFGDGYISDADRPFVESIARLKSDGTMYAHYAKCSIELAERFDTSRLAEHLIAVYGDVLARSEAERARSA
jgi:1,2-diacylglycerol-3-alpha-glucose alpha-1,2-galactosyltransferase